MTARVRVPTNAVWATVIFALNVFAFIFIGSQIRPILADLDVAERDRYFLVAAAVLATVIVVRIAWHMGYNTVVRWRHARFGFHPPRPMLRPTVGSGLVISWSGMRGIVTLAAALALPDAFPMRNLIVFVAFAVVLGTLVIQGFTLKFLLQALHLHDGDPVATEVRKAREQVAAAALNAAAGQAGEVPERVRLQFTGLVESATRESHAAEDESFRAALRAARRTLLHLRESGEIGDDAFHEVENELDWMENSDPLRAANADKAQA